MREIIVGIDLGTTNSAVAYLKDGVPEIIPIDGQSTMPSCVGLDPQGALIVGQAARNMLIAAPDSTILSIKRKMGQDTKVQLGDKSLSPEEVSALILRRLKEEAERHLCQPVNKAVITVPAFFDESQRKATQNAGALAGLEVVRMINEPTAAALAYEAGHTQDERLLVYDLGGGTFDVSVVLVEGDVVEVKASHGDTHLGGDDFDQLLVQHVVDAFHEKHGIFLNEDPKTLRRLKVILERAKIHLSDEPFVKIHEEYIHGDLHLEMEIRRSEYEELIAPYLQKTLDCIHRSLQDAKLLPRDVAKVMLVGGASRTPLVHEMLEENIGIVPRWEINPDLIVALGASISAATHAGEKTKAILVDITPHSFGIEVFKPDYLGGYLEYVPIIHRNTPLPVSRSELFTTSTDDQTVVEVKVYQGEDPNPDRNTLVGEFLVEGISKRPRGNPVVVHFSLDLNGMLQVTATEKITGYSKTVTLDTRKAAASFDIQQARRNIDALLESSEEEGEAGEKEVLALEAGPSGEPADEHKALLATAKDLRKRGEALLGSGISETDATEIKTLLDQSFEAVKAHDWQKLSEMNESLSDLVYYLED